MVSEDWPAGNFRRWHSGTTLRSRFRLSDGGLALAFIRPFQLCQPTEPPSRRWCALLPSRTADSLGKPSRSWIACGMWPFYRSDHRDLAKTPKDIVGSGHPFVSSCGLVFADSPILPEQKWPHDSFLLASPLLVGQFPAAECTTCLPLCCTATGLRSLSKHPNSSLGIRPNS